MHFREICIRFLILIFIPGSIPLAHSDIEQLIMGGRLYDKWWLDLSLEPPLETHPSYPDGGSSAGADTWRCKECHGWDYLGKKGAYAKGNHFTGISGIMASAKVNPAKIEQRLRDSTHRFNLVMDDQSLSELALFVSRGQLSMSKYVDQGSNKAKGDARSGKRFFKRYCIACHGQSGNKVHKSGDTSAVVQLGRLARKNPWEVLHKIRFGHPGVAWKGDDIRSRANDHHVGRPVMRAMLPMVNRLAIQEQIDLLTFLQHLP